MTREQRTVTFRLSHFKRRLTSLESKKWRLTSTENIRLFRDGEKGGRGFGGGGRGRLYTYRHTVTTRMTPALRLAAMRAILIFHIIVRDKVTRQCPQTATLEEKGEPKRVRSVTRNVIKRRYIVKKGSLLWLSSCLAGNRLCIPVDTRVDPL